MPERKGEKPRRSLSVSIAAVFLTYIGFPIVFFGSIIVARKILENEVIDYVIGPHAYENGLRIVGRHGDLTDGRRLPNGWSVFVNAAPFFVRCPHG